MKIKIDEKESKVFARLRKFCSDKETNKLNCVRKDIFCGKSVFVATDGRRLIIQGTEGLAGGELDKLPIGEYFVKVNKKSVELTENNDEYYHYPNWRSAIAKKGEYNTFVVSELGGSATSVIIGELYKSGSIANARYIADFVDGMDDLAAVSVFVSASSPKTSPIVMMSENAQAIMAPVRPYKVNITRDGGKICAHPISTEGDFNTYKH